MRDVCPHTKSLQRVQDTCRLLTETHFQAMPGTAELTQTLDSAGGSSAYKVTCWHLHLPCKKQFPSREVRLCQPNKHCKFLHSTL